MEEKTKIKYRSINDIIKSMQIACECGVREKSFSWEEISVRSFRNRLRIIRICKPYGKIERVPQGFIIKFDR